jgi:hypothetical protein
VRRTHPKRFWLIARHRTGGMEVLTANLARGGEALPVFSFEDEANTFLRLGAFGDDWRARETACGELVSVLCGPCASVERVVLDPISPPGPLTEGLDGPSCTEREAFVGSLLNPRPSRTSESGPSLARGRAGTRANGNVHEEVTEEVTGMWNKLFGGRDEPPRAKVNAVVRVVDRYLSEEARLRGLQSERQTIHPRDLPPDRRRALIEEVFAILGQAEKR